MNLEIFKGTEKDVDEALFSGSITIEKYSAYYEDLWRGSILRPWIYSKNLLEDLAWLDRIFQKISEKDSSNNKLYKKEIDLLSKIMIIYDRKDKIRSVAFYKHRNLFRSRPDFLLKQVVFDTSLKEAFTHKEVRKFEKLSGYMDHLKRLCKKIENFAEYGGRGLVKHFYENYLLPFLDTSKKTTKEASIYLRKKILKYLIKGALANQRDGRVLQYVYELPINEEKAMPYNFTMCQSLEAFKFMCKYTGYDSQSEIRQGTKIEVMFSVFQTYLLYPERQGIIDILEYLLDLDYPIKSISEENKYDLIDETFRKGSGKCLRMILRKRRQVVISYFKELMERNSRSFLIDCCCLYSLFISDMMQVLLYECELEWDKDTLLYVMAIPMQGLDIFTKSMIAVLLDNKFDWKIADNRFDRFSLDAKRIFFEKFEIFHGSWINPTQDIRGFHDLLIWNSYTAKFFSPRFKQIMKTIYLIINRWFGTRMNGFTDLKWVIGQWIHIAEVNDLNDIDN